MPIIRIDNPEVFVGLDSTVAKSQIEDHGYACRVVHVDNRTLVHESLLSVKVDYDPLRVNLWVKAGKITAATIG